MRFIRTPANTQNKARENAAANRIIASAEQAANVDISALRRALENDGPAVVADEARALARRLAELSIALSADAHDLMRATNA
jgi:hypothetical protein